MYKFLACTIGCGDEGFCEFDKEDITPDQDEYPNGCFEFIIYSLKLFPLIVQRLVEF